MSVTDVVFRPCAGRGRSKAIRAAGVAPARIPNRSDQIDGRIAVRHIDICHNRVFAVLGGKIDVVIVCVTHRELNAEQSAAASLRS